MVDTLKRPADTPAAACGRCFWWNQTDDEGDGYCLVYREPRWYKCMVCDKYDMDSYSPRKEAQDG